MNVESFDKTTADALKDKLAEDCSSSIGIEIFFQAIKGYNYIIKPYIRLAIKCNLHKKGNSIQETVRTLFSMKSINLSNRNINSRFLERMNNLLFQSIGYKQIEELDLSYNENIHELPLWVGNLINLKGLYLGNTPVAVLPEYLQKLPEIGIIDLQGTQVSAKMIDILKTWLPNTTII